MLVAISTRALIAARTTRSVRFLLRARIIRGDGEARIGRLERFIVAVITEAAIAVRDAFASGCRRAVLRGVGAVRLISGRRVEESRHNEDNAAAEEPDDKGDDGIPEHALRFFYFFIAPSGGQEIESGEEYENHDNGKKDAEDPIPRKINEVDDGTPAVLGDAGFGRCRCDIRRKNRCRPNERHRS